MIYILLWWLIIELLGWGALPIAYRAFRWLPDRGYIFAKSLGLLLASYIFWLGATTGFMRNDTGGIFFASLIVLGLSAGIFFKGSHRDLGPIRQSLPVFLRQHKRLIWTVELLFLTAFVVWVGLRAYAADKIMNAGGEKFMEMAFLNGTLNSPQFPPLDPWLSGFAISYYYFGYVMMAMITRLSGAPAGIGFELYDALLFALTVVGVFGIVYNLVANAIRPGGGRSDRQPVLYGLLGSLLVVLMGNLEGLLESLRSRGILSESFLKWIDIPGLAESPVTGSWFPGESLGWWWWRASRVIQDRDLFNQPVGISPITEFPFFSFLLGDNHPHVLALPFVLLCIALALNLLLHQVSVERNSSGVLNASPWWNPATASLNGDWGLFLLSALCLGSLGFLNTWDMPIYLGLATLAYGMGNYLVRRQLDGDLIRRTLVLGAWLLVASLLLYALFFVGFGSQAGGILPYVFPPTRLPQYLVMFGGFIFIITWFLISSLIRETRLRAAEYPVRTALSTWGKVILAWGALFLLVLAAVALGGVGRQLLNGSLEDPAVQSALGGMSLVEAFTTVMISRLIDPWLFLLLSFLIALSIANVIIQVRARPAGNVSPGDAVDCSHTSNLFATLLVFVGVALTLSVEFLYLRDTFGARMNTVFKFYYQGWVMLGCASAYGIWWVLNQTTAVSSRLARGAFQTITTILIAAGLVYPLMASYSRVGGFRVEPNLDGTANLSKSNPDDWAAIEWLGTNAIPDPNAVGQKIPVILEAPGGNYDYRGRISAFSGVPAVLGWALHEAQWRGNYIEQGKREPDIQTIYTTSDAQTALDLLHKWQVRYVILGATERGYIQQLCTDSTRVCNLQRALRKFDLILIPVFQQGEMTIYEVPGT